MKGAPWTVVEVLHCILLLVKLDASPTQIENEEGVKVKTGNKAR
jgi:hypothetical protein